ncbi:fimbrial protein [Providencia rettgeri]|uniref:fimbrial protein n=1 Tax=Providencia rettgeri TaxID=587 RepID=UPI0034E05AA2
MNLLKKSGLALLVCVSLPALSAVQNMPINIKGTFSNVTQPCTDTKLEFTTAFGAINTLEKVGDETSYRSSGGLSFNCQFPAKAKLTFTANNAPNAPDLFKTSSDAFGVKLKYNDVEVKPGQSNDLNVSQGSNYISFQTSMKRVLANGPNDFGNHTFDIIGNLAITYQ